MASEWKYQDGTGERVGILRRGSGLEGLRKPKTTTPMEQERFASDIREWYDTSGVAEERNKTIC